MHNPFRTVILLLAIALYLGIIGCGSPHPSLSEIAPIQTYPETTYNWNTNAICLVGKTDDAAWKWNLPYEAPAAIQWIKQNTAMTLQDLMQQELKNMGYAIMDFNKDYPTRNKRLGINKIVLFHNFDMNKTMVKEGVCYDMKLNIIIVNNPNNDNTEECEIWGRCFVPAKQTKLWVDVYRECVSNLNKVPEFRRSLEIDSSI